MGTLAMFLLGMAMGSFLGASVWRLKEGKSVLAKQGVDKTRSLCEHCGHKLSPLDLIPVISWVALRGKCRYCRKRIHWQHPVVEIITGTAFALSWHYLSPTVFNSNGEWLHFSLWMIFLSGLITLAIYDIKHLEILNRIIYPMIALVILYRFFDGLFLDGGANSMREMTQGLLVGGGFFLALFYISKERWIGGGDVKLGFFFGAWLGPAAALVALIIGFYSAFFVVIPLLMSKKISKKQPVPFGPFLIVGIFIATIWGNYIFDWYVTNFI